MATFALLYFSWFVSNFIDTTVNIPLTRGVQLPGCHTVREREQKETKLQFCICFALKR